MTMPTGPSGRDKVVGHWVHAHEEDEAGCRVFRRVGAELPPSRGRAELVITPDLKARRIGPGADDRPAEKGSLQVRVGDDGGAAASDEELRILRATGDRLYVARD